MIGPRDAGALTTSETVESTKGPRVASACTAAVTSETAFDGDEIPNSPVPLDILLSFAFQWWREFTTFDPGQHDHLCNEGGFPGGRVCSG